MRQDLNELGSGLLRFLVFVIGQLMLILPILENFGISPLQVVAITLVTIAALLGFNAEVLIRLSRQVAEYLEALADEIEGSGNNAVVQPNIGRDRVLGGRNRGDLRTYPRPAASNSLEERQRQRESESRGDVGGASVQQVNAADVIGRSQIGAADDEGVHRG